MAGWYLTVKSLTRNAKYVALLGTSLLASVLVLGGISFAHDSGIQATRLITFRSFDQDLIESKQILGGARIGEFCDRLDATWMRDARSPQPVLVAYGDFSSGTCVIGGWSYRSIPLDLVASLPRWSENSRVALVPVFDDNGDVIRYQDPPKTVVDNVYLDD